MYVCQKCKRKIEDNTDTLTCPYCGYKIFRKDRPPIAKKVKAE
ncbi:MAG: zinc-ribbon domain-containing protein [Candidatus Diapherotrites archaeon]|nr:zinc-ribbon domain-containing protein [Candidatus Diapherotrites archaeon]